MIAIIFMWEETAPLEFIILMVCFFNSIATIPLGVTTPNKYVYDIKLDRIKNLLYVCGSGFVGTYSVPSCTQYSISTSCIGYNNGTAIVSVTSAISSPTTNYTWVNNTGTLATTSSTLTSDTLKNLTFGSYTVYVQTNAPNGPIVPYTFSLSCVPCSVTASASISCGPGVTTNLNLVSSGGFVSAPSYTWIGPSSYSSTGSPNVSFLSGNVYGTYTLTAKDETCTYSTVVNVDPLPAYSSSISTVSVTCNGGSNGVTLLSLSGGTSPFTFSWSTVPTQTNASAGSLTAGIYTCTVTDGKSCITTHTVQVTEPPTVFSLTINSATTQCVGNTITMNGFATGGVPSYNYSWTPGPNTYSYTVYQSTPGVYTYSLKVTDSKGCVATQSINLNFTAPPTLTVGLSTPSNTICSGQSLTLTANGASSYTWNSSIASNSLVITPTANVSYFLLGSDANGCMGSISTPLYITTCTDLKEKFNKENFMSVYPNPNSGEFIVEFNETSKSLSLEIYNSIGQIIIQEKLSTDKTKVNLNEYSNGMYFLRVVEDNQTRRIFRIIKQ